MTAVAVMMVAVQEVTVQEVAVMVMAVQEVVGLPTVGSYFTSILPPLPDSLCKRLLYCHYHEINQLQEIFRFPALENPGVFYH